MRALGPAEASCAREEKGRRVREVSQALATSWQGCTSRTSRRRRRTGASLARHAHDLRPRLQKASRGPSRGNPPVRQRLSRWVAPAGSPRSMPDTVGDRLHAVSRVRSAHCSSTTR